MTAWPLNCAAAHAADMVFWRRGGETRHGLLIDTPAVPLRFEVEAATVEAGPAFRAEAEAEPTHGQRIAQMFVVKDLKPR